MLRKLLNTPAKALMMMIRNVQHTIQNIYRITAAGDPRITAAGDKRITADSDY